MVNNLYQSLKLIMDLTNRTAIESLIFIDVNQSESKRATLKNALHIGERLFFTRSQIIL